MRATVLGVRRDAPDYGEPARARPVELSTAGIGAGVEGKKQRQYEYASFYGL